MSELSRFLPELWLAVGVGAGVLLLWLDERWLVRQYTEPNHPRQLVTRSLLFLAAFIPLSLFVLTSSGSALGMGIIVGIGGGLSSELIMRRNHPAELSQRFGLPQEKKWTELEQRWLWMGFSLYTLLISLAAIFLVL